MIGMSTRRERRETDVARRTFPYESRLECARAHVGGLETTLRRLERDAPGRGAEATRDDLRRLIVRARSARDDVRAARNEVGMVAMLNLWIPFRWPYMAFELWGLTSAGRRLARCVRWMHALRARVAPRVAPTR